MNALREESEEAATSSHSLTRALRLMLVFTLLAPASAAQARKLNAPLAQGGAGSVASEPRVTADGRHVVYQADDDADGSYELFSAVSDGSRAPVRLVEGPAQLVALDEENGRAVYRHTDGLFSVALDGTGVPIELSGPLGPYEAYGSASFDASGSRLVYRRILYSFQPNEYGTFERLFSVPALGGTPPVELNEPLPPGGSVWLSQLTPDGSEVCFTVDDELGRIGLRVAPLDGSAPPRELPVPLHAGGDVLHFFLDPAGERVFYVADARVDQLFELHSIALDGSEPPRTIVGGQDVGRIFLGQWPDYIAFLDPLSIALAADGSRILFEADPEGGGHHALLSAPVDGSAAPVVLSAPSDLDVRLAGQSPATGRALYLESEGRFLVPRALFSVPIDGSAPALELTGPPSPTGELGALALAADGLRVVYTSDHEVGGRYELFVRPADGSAAALRLNPPLVPGGSVQGIATFEEFVVYMADQAVDELVGLHLAPLAGGHGHELAAGPVTDFVVGGKRAFFRDEQRELFSVAVEPGAKVAQLHALPLVTVGDVQGFDLAADGARVAYRADQALGGWPALHVVDASGKGDPLELFPGLPGAGRVVAQRFDPDGQRIVFALERGAPGTFDLLSVPADGTGMPVVLATEATSLSGSEAFALTPDGLRVLFTRSVAGLRRLFGVAIDGSSAPVDLSPETGTTSVFRLTLSADGGRVAYLALAPAQALYVAPTDGSTPAVSIQDGGVQEGVRLTADGSHVVFLQGLDVFVAPGDGSAPPMRLNADLPAGGFVSAFELSADGKLVVYLADQRQRDRFELFVVPLDGSEPPRLAHPAMAPNRDVRRFQLAPGGERVVYLADARVDQLFELFAAPLAGGAQVRLSGTPVPGGEVLDFAVSPDGRRVVYRADQDVDGLVGLYSASIRGARDGVRLSRALVPGGDVRAFRISADSSTVAFTAERDAQGALTLLAAPITGREKATEVAGPFVEGGGVLDFALGADGARLVWRADQEQQGVIELYAAP